jgi:hypothetical protein
MADATAPPDIPKLGDDQYAFTAGPGAFLGVVEGDAYVEITGVFLPETLARWQVESDVARATFAAQH